MHLQTRLLPISLLFSFLLHLLLVLELVEGKKICIIGSGIGGSSTSFFTSVYSTKQHDIHVFESRNTVGGRASSITLSGKSFEAGASIIHERNIHLKTFAKMLGLKIKKPVPSRIGIWNGKEFVYLDKQFGHSKLLQLLSGYYNFFSINYRYNPLQLLQMNKLIQNALDKWLKLYESNEKSYGTVKELLHSIDLWNETQKTLDEILIKDNHLSSKLVNELVTAITRVQYGQNSSMSGLAGLVALIGTGGSLWSVENGNWRISDGLISTSNATLHLSKPVKYVRRVSIRDPESDVAADMAAEVAFDGYELGFEGEDDVYRCDAVVIATPLEESGRLQILPPVSVPSRSFHHTHVTFVRGLLDENYFELNASNIPELISTMEDDAIIPFSSISKLHEYGKNDFAYKIFSRKTLSHNLLDKLFSWKNETVTVDWAAYPKFHSPEQFAPFLLDSHHLYYVNAFENGVSAMEASAVSARNVALLLLKRMEESMEVNESRVVCDADEEREGEELELAKQKLVEGERKGEL